MLRMMLFVTRLADQLRPVALPLVAAIPEDDHKHADGDKGAKQRNHPRHRQVQADEQGVEQQHEQHADVLVEVLHRDRMPRRQQHIAPVLQQRVHRHHKIPGQCADEYHEAIGEQHVKRQLHHPEMQLHVGQQLAVEKRQRHGGQPHAHAQRQHAQALFQRHAHGSADRPSGHAQRHGRLHHRRHGEIQPQCMFRPLQHDELQRRPRAPEQGGDRQRNLPQLVGPQHLGAMRKINQQRHQPGFLFFVTRPGIGNAQIA